MKATYLKLGVYASLTALAFTFSYCAPDPAEETPEETDDIEEVASSDTPDSLCYAKPSWFPHSQTPPPEEGKGSPFDVSSTTNQIFHQWSWQKFLWLTKPEANGNPLFLNQTSVIQVDANMNQLSPPSGTTVILTDTEQAGPDQSILQVNPAYSGSSASHTVYYSIHTSSIMYRAAIALKDSIKNGTLPANNFSTFPVGSLELKVSWVDVAAIPKEKLGQYYTTTASFASGTKTVALLGMHVVGVVQNHPEFIWATFEHDELGPAYDWANNNVSETSDKLLFSVGSETGIDGILYDKTTKLGKSPYRVFDLFQYGVPRNSDGSFMATSQSEPENFNNIAGINECVKSNLRDVWKNYFYNGSIWLNTDGMTPTQQAQLIVRLGGAIGSGIVGASARGSLNNANITMETFTQTFQTDITAINVNNLTNCFSCHNANSFSGNTSPIYLSHVFDGYMNQSQGMTKAEIETLKLKHEKMTFGKR